MKFFKTFKALSLLAVLISACSITRKEQQINPADTAAESVHKINLPELKGSAGKASWAEYKLGMEALEAEDFVAAQYYLDLALGEIVSEMEADSLGSPEDSAYFAELSNRIIPALESLYPKLMSQTSLDSEQAYSVRNDYESLLEEFDEFDETPLDSAEKVVIGSFLDTINLSRFSLPMEINARVMKEIHYLTATKARNFTGGALSRKTMLDSMIYAKLKERKMPEDLIYLAFIESGFKVQAYSRAKAAGVWQFIPGTGKRYGLPVDFWLDMRRNPEAATNAALSYLSDLYDEFGDWYLAMAAYNCGEGRIRRLVRESLAAKPSLKKVSYWDLKLPRETMHYVPRILAAAIVGHFPEHYSFTVEQYNLVPFDTATIKDCIPLDKVGSAVGASTNTIRDLNPELMRWCTPPNLKSYTLRVPQGSREKFLAAYEKMDKTQLVRWQQYKVKKGDNIGSISKLFGLKVADVQAANNLKGTRLSVGQVLIIPMPVGANPPKDNKKATEKAELQASAVANGAEIDSHARFYVVRKGDNLSSVSRRFGISSQNLMTWNGMQSNKVLVGQKLYLQDPIKKPEKITAVAKNNSAAGDSSSYVVKEGDSLWDIARTHDVTVQQLLEWNPGIDKKIFPGMKIKIAN
ncbi:MAG: LysM peptidoglycan-binding domain-containing protein [Fibromonadaceae bacterium]|nr:LysM peptidoglycan-binding domain-containing protein [Fibromonadaceae bacterium]